MTGCDFAEALEAAHISPYRGEHTNDPQNGLLLRSDLHTLFDLGHLAISDDFQVVMSSQAKVSLSYQQFHGKTLNLPERIELRPSFEVLKRHREWAGL